MKTTRMARLSAAVILSATALGGAAPALAAPTNTDGGAPVVAFGGGGGGGGTLTPAAIANIVDTNTATLNIHKYLGMPTDVPNNGTEADFSTVDGGAPTPLAGVNFNVYRVYLDQGLTQPVDLTSNAGWQSAASINGYVPTAAEIAAGSFTANGTTYYLGAPAEVTTGADGTATMADADLGLYFVSENIQADDTITTPDGEEIDGLAVTSVKPFFVTLPMTEPNDRTSWMYEVNVYPKNQANTITKQVIDGPEDSVLGDVRPDAVGEETPAADEVPIVGGNGSLGVTAGSDILYRLSSTVNPNKNALGYYAITDVLPEGVVYGGVNGMVLRANNGDQVTLIEGEDFVVNQDGQRIVISLTESGLAKAQVGGVIETDVRVTVDTDASSTNGGVQENTAGLIPSADWFEQNNPGVPVPTPGEPTDVPGIPSNEVESRFGDLLIVKNGQDSTVEGNPTYLAGAEFALHADVDNNGVCNATDVDSPALATTTSGENGVAAFTNMRLSNFYNNQDQADPQSHCVVETKAPAGYELLADPILFDLTVAGAQGVDGDTQTVIANAGDDNITDAAGNTLQVTNMKSNLGNVLPLTGGDGVSMLWGAGALLALAGVGTYGAMRRRGDAQKADAPSA